jgi:hypothetical protein
VEFLPLYLLGNRVVQNSFGDFCQLVLIEMSPQEVQIRARDELDLIKTQSVGSAQKTQSAWVI